jgi:hypothetical protein
LLYALGILVSSRSTTSRRLSENAQRNEPFASSEAALLHSHFVHRRLNQEREGDAARGGGIDGKDNKHATSYAQRHQYHYSGSSSSSSSSSSSTGTSSSALFSSSYYKYDDDGDSGNQIHRRYHYNQGRFSTNLSDVWLCLLTALGWSVWMISSFQASRHQKNHHRFLAAAGTGTLDAAVAGTDARFYDDSVLFVRGNVRDVLLADHGGGVMPIYTAIVDYIIEREDTHECIQIRKHFDTSQVLEQGFANVELLVLPGEPTQSILKEDFYQQVEEERRAAKMMEDRAKRRGIGMDDENATKPDNDTLGDILEGHYCKWKRVSTCFASLLVLASLAGTVQVVCLIDPDKRWQGWVSFCIGVALLLPLALSIHKFMVACTRWHEQPEKQGFIVQTYTTAGAHSSRYDSSSLQQACMPPSGYCGAMYSDSNARGADDMGDLDNDVAGNERRRRKPPTYAEVASYIVPEMSGCYFVHYPTHHSKMSSRSNHGRPVEDGSALCTIRNTTPNGPNDLQQDESNNDILSTSSVSSISDQDPNESDRQRR